MLETSDIYDPKTKQYYDHYYDLDGNLVPATVELTLTMMDYHLLLEHYDLSDTEYIDGCWFATEIGLFDRYMEKYKKIKMESKGAMRELAKLFLNNLYGKMASSTDSSFKVFFMYFFIISSPQGVWEYCHQYITKERKKVHPPVKMYLFS